MVYFETRRFMSVNWATRIYLYKSKPIQFNINLPLLMKIKGLYYLNFLVVGGCY